MDHGHAWLRWTNTSVIITTIHSFTSWRTVSNLMRLSEVWFSPLCLTKNSDLTNSCLKSSRGCFSFIWSCGVSVCCSVFYRCIYLHIAQGIAPVLIWFKYTLADCLCTVVFLPHRRSTNFAFAEVVCGAALISSHFFSKNLYFSALYEVYFLFAF